MKTYRPEKSADLEFSFPTNLQWYELDKQGVKLPIGMQLVDLVIEREADTLLVEVKDPSHSRCPLNKRESYFKGLSDNSILTEELTPKARDSYTFLHLMEKDKKPLKYIVLIGLDAFDDHKQKALLTGFKDRLVTSIRFETAVQWKRNHISECVVLSVQSWNDSFPNWPVKRLSSINTAGGATP